MKRQDKKQRRLEFQYSSVWYKQYKTKEKYCSRLDFGPHNSPIQQAR